MDDEKAIAVSKFIKFKSASFGSEFTVNLEINNAANNWTSILTGLIIENNIPKEDFTFIFMNDIVATNPYLGYVQMDMAYLSDMQFDDKYLYFSTNSKRVRLS
ncbi:MAG: hypothetical protein IKR40_09065 [Treponema sp.]|nr:hypothetical protein [Treponema sp.]